ILNGRLDIIRRWMAVCTALACIAPLAAPAQDFAYPNTGGNSFPADSRGAPPQAPNYQQRPAYAPPNGPQAGPYGQPYGNRVEPQNAPAWNAASPGPYDDYRQGYDNFQPNFAPQPAPPVARPELFEPARVIAIVGGQHILAGDMLGDINQMLKPYEGKMSESDLNKQRQLLMQQMLPQMIQNKMLYQEMLGQIPEDNVNQIHNKLAHEFDDKQLPNLMERAKLDSPAELDAKLREFGSSIEKQRRLFTEQILAREYIRQSVKGEPNISHQEMLEYYHEHSKDYEREARVRWEELAVWSKNFNSKVDAYREMANMGNRVLRGAAFSRVAREQSQGYTSSDGGWHDWTIRGSLRATNLEDALFDLPLGELSRIIETEDGFHIVRVLDREDAGRVPFDQEQGRIKLVLQKERRDKEVDDFIAKIQRRTRVWTVFDDGGIE
ncbi:MAG: peptidylprolyl isomerase, partial [Planctomycetales bacterium]|nr:peptidylprolyl isomerase [Planctomycetales bacterium]